MSDQERTDPLSHGEPDAVSRLLDGLPDIDPPATLVADVMSSIQRTRVVDHRGPVQFRRQTMAKKVLWGVIGVAAAVLLAMRVIGYPPSESGTEGTIGAAQRYQAPQISNADVKVTDAQLQAFLQSDAFERLKKDKAARAALRNKDFQKAMGDEKVRAFLAEPGMMQALAAPGVMQALSQPAVMQALGSPAFMQVLQANGPQVAMASPAVQQAIASAPGVMQALASQPFAQVLAAPGVADLFSSQAFWVFMSSPDAAQALASPSMMDTLANPQFSAALASPSLYQAAGEALQAAEQ